MKKSELRQLIREEISLLEYDRIAGMGPKEQKKVEAKLKPIFDKIFPQAQLRGKYDFIDNIKITGRYILITLKGDDHDRGDISLIRQAIKSANLGKVDITSERKGGRRLIVVHPFEYVESIRTDI